MYFAKITRDQIIEAIQNAGQIEKLVVSKSDLKYVLEEAKSSEIFLIWDTKNEESTPIWVTEQKATQEVLAYIDTYIKLYRPFTAFFRVIPKEVLIPTLNRKKIQNSANLSKLIGISIAEAIVRFERESQDLDSVSLQACLATFSSTIIMALQQGADADEIRLLFENWSTAHSLIGPENSNLSNNQLISFWLPIISLVSGSGPSRKSVEQLSPNTHQVLENYVKNGQLTRSDWDALCKGVQSVSELYDSFKGVRELGVRDLKELLSILREEKTSLNNNEDLIWGAAISMISAGSYDLMPYAQTYSAEFPTSILWYAFFAGYSSESSLFVSSRSLAFHIEKELFRKTSLFAAPSSDISLSELLVILNENINIIPFRTAHNAILNVELIPLVNARFKVKQSSPLTQTEMASESQLTNQEVYELTYLLQRANKLLQTRTSSQRIIKSKPTK